MAPRKQIPSAEQPGKEIPSTEIKRKETPAVGNTENVVMIG